MKKNVTFFAICAVFLALVIFFFLSLGNIKTRVLFTKMRFQRRNPSKADELARRLAASRSGIDLCIRDMDAYGGKTQAWSSQAILYSNDVGYVRKRLASIAKGNYRLSKKIEANSLLWLKFKEKIYIVELYDLVRNKAVKESPNTVKIGRLQLLGFFHHDKDAQRILDKPPSEDLDLSIKEWEKFCDEHITLLEQKK